MKKKAEFSKVIIASVSIATALVVIASFVLMFIYGDLSPLTYIIGGCFAELASATGFYYWKAKNENMIKLNHLTESEIPESNYNFNENCQEEVKG